MQDRSTDFEFLPIDVSLGRCQRYFAKLTGASSGTAVGVGISTSTSSSSLYVKFPTTMRSAPTLSYNSLVISDTANYGPTVTSIGSQVSGNDSSRLVVNHGATASSNRVAVLQIDTASTGFLAMDIEL